MTTTKSPTLHKDTPDYVKSLITPREQKATVRKAWAVDVPLWVSFFAGQIVVGNLSPAMLPLDNLGAPVRLAYEKDGQTPRFNKAGMPVTVLPKPLTQMVGMVRENFVAGLQAEAARIQAEFPDAYAKLMQQAEAAGKAITDADLINLGKELQRRAKLEKEEAAKAEAAEKLKAEKKAARGKAKGKPEDPPNELAERQRAAAAAGVAA